jgi:uncharacterized protein YjiS (DUF1127 family)
MIANGVKAGTSRSGGSLLTALAELWRASQERAQLLALTDRELRDIGISRVDALREAERPLRQWRTH